MNVVKCVTWLVACSHCSLWGHTREREGEREREGGREREGERREERGEERERERGGEERETGREREGEERGREREGGRERKRGEEREAEIEGKRERDVYILWLGPAVSCFTLLHACEICTKCRVISNFFPPVFST